MYLYLGPDGLYLMVCGVSSRVVGGGAGIDKAHALTRKVCNTMAFSAMLSGCGPLFYILVGSRCEPWSK